MNSVPYIFWAILESVVILLWGPGNFQLILYDQAPRCPDWTILGQVLRGGVQILLYLSQKYFTSSLLYLLNSKVRIESCIFNCHSQPKAIVHSAIYQVLQFTTYINPIETWVCNRYPLMFFLYAMKNSQHVSSTCCIQGKMILFFN